jgi:hypothetical protein
VKFIKREWLWLTGLALLVGLIWAGHYDRLSPASWGLPPEQAGDAAISLCMIKIASEGDSPIFLSKTVEHLGAPFKANWDDWPLPEKIILAGLGLVARWFGVFQASNFAVLMAHVSAALVFYFCCRFLKYRREWALAGAVLFAYTYYFLWRGLGHLLIAYGYPIPLAILSCWLIGASKGMNWGDRRFWVCAVTALVMGFGNPYNLNLYLQLLGLGMIAHYFTARRKTNLQIGLVCVAIAVLAFVCINANTLLFQFQHGKNTGAISRNYFEAELYALKPMELLVPPTGHRLGLLADLGRNYVSSTYFKGEIFAPYLGLLAGGGLIWLAVESWRAALRRSRSRFPAHMLQVAWVFLYSIIGGFNCLVALGGIVLFRSSNRYSVFISAILWLFVVGRLSRLTAAWKPAWRWGLAGGLLLIGLADQIPPNQIREGSVRDDSTTARLIRSDRAFVAAMEAKMPPGAMVYQLPIIEFPGGGGVHNASEYELFRPYLHSKNLRFSFGDIRGRPRETWQRDVEKMAAPQMVAALEKYGFSAIYVCRKGFADNGEGLLKQLAAAGRDQMIEDDLKEQVCVLLKPSLNPALPSEDLALVIYREGWSVTERIPGGPRRWSNGNALAAFFNEHKNHTPFSVKCQIGSPTARQVTMVMAGKEIWRASLGAGQVAAVDVVVDARKGYNRLEFVTDAPPVQASPNSNQTIAFAVIDLRVTRVTSTQ